MDGVGEGSPSHRAEREAEQPGVVRDHVELAGAQEARNRVTQLPERVPDPLARCNVVDELEARFRVRVTGSEQRDVVAVVDQAVREERHDPLDPPVGVGRHREPDGAEDGDPHAASMPIPSADDETSHVRPSARTPCKMSVRAVERLHSRQCVQPPVGRVGLEAEQEPEKQEGRPRRPGLGTRRSRISDREGRLRAVEAGEDFGKRPVEMACRLEQRGRDLRAPASQRPYRLSPQAASAVSWGQTVPLW